MLTPAQFAAMAVLAMSSPGAIASSVEQAPAVPTAPLQPLTPWASYHEGYRCTAERTFGPKPGIVAFKFGRTAFPDGPGGDDIIIRGEKRFARAKELTLVFDQGPQLTMAARLVDTTRPDIPLLHIYPDDWPFWRSFCQSNHDDRGDRRARRRYIGNAGRAESRAHR